MKKVKICGFGSGKWFWLSTIAQLVVAGEWQSNPLRVVEKSVINMI
jgi:hypothetical protein